MNTCCSCGTRGSCPHLTAQSEQVSADRTGFDPLFACTNARACEARVMALDADYKTLRAVQLGGTAARSA